MGKEQKQKNALKIYKKIFQENNKNSFLRLKVAHLTAIFEKNFDYAENLLKKSLEQDKKNFQNFQNLYDYYTSFSHTCKDYDKKALALASNAYRIFLHNEKSSWLIINHFLQNDDLSSAEKILTEIINDKNYPPKELVGIIRIAPKVVTINSKIIRKLIEKLEQSKPTKPDVLEIIANHYLLTNNPQKALKIYHQIYTKSSDSMRIRKIIFHTLKKIKKPKEALKTLLELAEINPFDYDTLFKLAGALADDKQTQAAISAYEKAFELEIPSNNDIQTAFEKLKNVHNSLKLYNLTRIAHEYYPEHPFFVYLLATMTQEKKNYLKSYNLFNNFEKMMLNLNKKEQLNSNFYNLYADSALFAKKKSIAAKLYKKAINIDPKNAHNPLNSLAYMWIIDNKNLDQAGELIKKALEMQPENYAYIDTLGWFYYKKGNYQQALKELKKAESLQKKKKKKLNPEILAHIAIVYQKLQKHQQAEKYALKASLAEKENQVYQKLYQKIKKRNPVNEIFEKNKTPQNKTTTTKLRPVF